MASRERNTHLKINKIKKKTHVCCFCGTITLHTEHANIGHGYNLNVNDWLELCSVCHRNIDNGNIGKIL